MRLRPVPRGGEGLHGGDGVVGNDVTGTLLIPGVHFYLGSVFDRARPY